MAIIQKKFPDIKFTVPRIKKALEERKQLFKDYFSTQFNKDFKDKEGDSFERAVTWCNDIDEFLKYHAMLEGKDWENQKNVIGIDYGKGSIKIILTLHDKTDHDNDDSETKKKERNLVKETKVLALVRDVPESHHNCEILFDLINLNN